ncbi:MAG: hypothetical protein ABF515_01570 [Bifidobacterium sp.]|nr:hypothetical protein [Bifidobacterium aquikefiri]
MKGKEMIHHQNSMKKWAAPIGFCLTAFLLSSFFVPAVSADELSDDTPASTGNVELIETGNVLNPDALINAGSATDDETTISPMRVTATTDELELQPTWQNPAYVSRTSSSGMMSRASVVSSVCTTKNYKVITKVGGEAGSGYVYQCWSGKGTYTSSTAFPTYGGGVTAVCPGNNKGQIYYRATWGGSWFWSLVRGPVSTNSTCYSFAAQMMYRSIRLNS